jgi:GTPase
MEPEQPEPSSTTIESHDAVVAIVGRPNVGKSTLFNRVIGKRLAVIAKEAGTTRDRIQQDLLLNGYNLRLVDTGGLQSGKKQDIEADVEKQAKVAIEKADIILFVIDTIQALTTDDFAVANILRRSKKHVILVANKCDHPKIEENIYNVYELGFGEPVQISAIHKIGVDVLLGEVQDKLKELKIKKKSRKKSKTAKAKKEEERIKVSFIGRPNAGKSSLLNSLLGENRVIVSDIPGTTRDTTDIDIEYKDNAFTIIDTAGIRRRGKIETGIEKFSIIRCKDAMSRSDISVILIDATEPVTAQDLHIIEFALKEKNGIILAVNKADLTEGDESDKILRLLRRKCDFLPWAPIVFISAKNKKNIYQLLDLAVEIYETRHTQISTPKLNKFLQRTVLKHLPASTGRFKSKLLYGSQTGDNPPKFTIFFKNAKRLHFSYKRYVENELRKEFGFDGTPISITFRENSE